MLRCMSFYIRFIALSAFVVAYAQEDEDQHRYAPMYVWDDDDTPLDASVLDEETYWAYLEPKETNCTAKVYDSLLHENALRSTWSAVPPENLLPVRYWFRPRRCYIFESVLYHPTDTVGDVAQRAARQSATKVNPAGAHLWLGLIRLYNNKYMRYFTSSVYNGGVLTLREEPLPKFSLPLNDPYGAFVVS